MDYQEFSGEVISEQDKAFAKEFTNFVNGRMCSAEKTGKELTERTVISSSRCSRCSWVSCDSWHTTIKKGSMTSVTSGHHGSPRKRTVI